MPIHQDRIEGLLAGASDGLQPIVGRRGSVAEAMELADGEQPIHLAVVDHEYVG
ncbi:MAG: hypothetical protein R2710_11945 [Acidimicrobiales bacterium]